MSNTIMGREQCAAAHRATTVEFVGMGELHRILSSGLVGALLGAVMMTPAQAETGITVAVSGPARITASTLEPTGRILANFTVTDPTMTATGATICRAFGESRRQGCRYQRFDGVVVESDDWYDDLADEDDEYTRWDVIGQPGSWTVSYPIGFEEMSDQECLAAALLDKPFEASIEVMNDAGAILATGSFSYEVTCTGIAGGSTGPDRTRVYASRSARSQPFTFLAVDTKRILSAYRICQYSSITERYSNCDYEQLTTKHRTKDGNWYLSYYLNWGPLGSSSCGYVGRKWPQAGFRVQWYDRSMKQQLSLFRGTNTDC